MKSRILLPALLVAGLFVLTSASNAQARIFGGGGCCEPSCCAAEPSCCAPEPSCCAKKCHRVKRCHRNRCCKPTCCAPACEPSCCGG